MLFLEDAKRNLQAITRGNRDFVRKESIKEAIVEYGRSDFDAAPEKLPSSAPSLKYRAVYFYLSYLDYFACVFVKGTLGLEATEKIFGNYEVWRRRVSFIRDGDARYVVIGRGSFKDLADCVAEAL